MGGLRRASRRGRTHQVCMCGVKVTRKISKLHTEAPAACSAEPRMQQPRVACEASRRNRSLHVVRPRTAYQTQKGSATARGLAAREAYCGRKAGSFTLGDGLGIRAGCPPPGNREGGAGGGLIRRELLPPPTPFRAPESSVRPATLGERDSGRTRLPFCSPIGVKPVFDQSPLRISRERIRRKERH